MSTKSKCRTCGEKIIETGNFQVKVLKSKPIPIKMQKLIKSGKLDENKKEALSQTKFGKFLLKRANQTNIVEITCLKCSSSCKINASKPKPLPEVTTDFDTPTLTNLSKSAKKRRRNQNKEVNAGLFIPSSADSLDKSSYEFKSDTPTKPNINSNENKKIPVLDKKKELDNLRKVLFKSKKKSNKGQGATIPSLKDFLSSI